MKTPPIVIVHGLNGSPEGHWQYWLANNLAGSGHAVCFPQFADATRPDLSGWLSQLEGAIKSCGHEKPPTVICHSLGVILWLHYISRNPSAMAGRVLLVAPPGERGNTSSIASFFPAPLPQAAQHASCRNTLLVFSSADPYCPEGADIAYAEPLGIRSMRLPDSSGHINMASGYGPWPWVA